MKLLRAEVQGFRSFSEAQVIDFAAMRPGLYHVTGRNEVEPELEANGAGKSSLFEAIFWALYGKTSRNLRAGTIKNWNSAEKCGVILDLQASSGSVSLLRSWGPNALEVSGQSTGDRPIDQPELEQMVGMTPEAFLFAVYFAQFSPAFVDLAAAEQTAVFSTILNLNLWERAAGAASERSGTVEQGLQQLREATARIQGQAEELLSQDYSKAEKSWKKEHEAELAVAQKQVEQSEAALATINKGQAAFNAATEAAARQMKLVTETTTEHRRLSQDVAKLSAQNITKCPTCGQPVSRQHIKKELDRVLAELKRKDVELVTINKEHERLLRRIPADYETKQRSAELELQLSSAGLKNVEHKANPYTKLRTEQEQRGEQLAKQLEETEGKLHTEEKRLKNVQYWVKGFKEIRLSLIRESLAQLTVEVNETLFQLGLQDWEVEFDIERETKSGGINRSFTVMIRAPHVNDLVPWGSWSGGESQRLRLAIMLGFSNMITSRVGVQPNIEFFDEPSQWLSETGITDLLEVLKERAERQQKIILLADHRSFSFGGFSGTITVTKDKNGSHISTASN